MVQARKSLGQNFLHNEAIIQDIVAALDVFGIDQILEVGPGEGALTKYLHKKYVKFKAVEKDDRLIDYLPNKFEGLELIHEDFLKYDLSKAFDGEFLVIGNFPYNISSQILFKILDHKEQVPGMVGMFQKELADRVASKEGNKQYGVVTVLIQLYFDVEHVIDVGPDNFRPAPKVWSSVIRLKRKENLDLGIDYKDVRRVVKQAFTQRRKVLNNTLKPFLKDYQGGDEFIDSILRLRPEALSVEQFVELSKRLKALND